MKKQIVVTALTNAGATTLYVFVIASFLFYAETFLGTEGKADTLLAPVIMLLLLVISAGFTGFAVLGKPAMWYLDGKKKDALHLLATTLFLLLLVALVLIWML